MITSTGKLKALTMMELVLVFAISAIIATSSFSVITRYYASSQVGAESKIIVSYLRYARQQAEGNSTGDAYSVKFLADRYIGFVGTVYNASDPENDEVVSRNDITITTTFTDDIVTFENYTGRLPEGGSITVTSNINGVSKQLDVNTLGVIDE